MYESNVVSYGTYNSAVRPTSDAITRYIESSLITRGAVTQAQFDAVRSTAIAHVGQRFELSEKGAAQAIDPVLRRLIWVETAPKKSVRRVPNAE